MNEQTINLTLSVNDVNTVLASLAKLPFEQVSGIITTIRDQAIPQLQQPETNQ